MLIDHVIGTMRLTRQHFLELTANCPPEEMNRVPAGFRNNLIWNLGHVVASQQTLCYSLSDLQPRVSQSHIELYKPTTVPVDFVGQEQIDEIRGMAIATIDQLQEDYHAGLFRTYQGRQTKFGVLLSNIDEAIAYVSTHESLHFGFSKALLKVLRN